MCGHTSSMHTGSGCTAKFLDPHTRKQVTCNCPFFQDQGDPGD